MIEETPHIDIDKEDEQNPFDIKIVQAFQNHLAYCHWPG
jgi:hypothetical protein